MLVCVTRPTELEQESLSPIEAPMLDAAPSAKQDTARARKAPPEPAPDVDLGAGVAIPMDVRRSAEQAFGGSLADVTLHDNPGAHAFASDNRARATTVGNRVAFGEGWYRPGTLGGDALIAHELAHAAQQATSTSTRVPAGLRPGSDGDEREANVAAAAALLYSGRHAGPIQRLTGLNPTQQQALRPERVGLRRLGALQLNSCSAEKVYDYTPDEDRFTVVTRKLSELLKRQQEIRDGKVPITARAELDEQIKLLVDELSTTFGVRLTPEQLFDALGKDATSLDHLITDLGAEIVVTPPPPNFMLQRLLFQLKLGLVPPHAPLEISWRWTADDARINQFFVVGPGGLAKRSSAMNLELDEGFWNILSPEITNKGGFKTLAYIYLRGAKEPLMKVSTPFLALGGMPGGSAIKLRAEVQRAGADSIKTEKVVTGTQVTFRVTDWAPDLRKHDVVWQVDGRTSPPYAVITQSFATVGEHTVSVEIWQKGDQRHLIGRDSITITVLAAATAAKPLLDKMDEQGLSALPAVRASMDTSVAALRPLAAEGQPGAELNKDRLNSQLKAIGKVDEFTADARGSKGMAGLQKLPVDLGLMTENQSYSGPIKAGLVVHSTTEVQPLAIHLVTWHTESTQIESEIGTIGSPAEWHARLIDMTGAHVIKFDGKGRTALAATDKAFRDWEDDNPYPQKCTVVYDYSPPGWTFPSTFSTSTTEKEVLAWIDGILLIGGIIVGGLLLLVPEPTMATKALGIAILAASVARAGYAIAQYRDLGYDWTSREIMLEGIGIVTSLVGVSGGMVRQAGVKAASSLLFKTGRAMMIASAAADAGTLVFLTYDAYRQIQLMQQDPTLDASQREMATLRMISGLLLQGVMLVVSNKDLFHGGLGRTPKFREKFGDPSGILPEGRARMEMELTLMESGVAARDLPKDPKALTDLFMAKQRAQHAGGELDRIRGELPADKKAQFDRERSDFDEPADFLDHLSGDGTRDPKGFFLTKPEVPVVSGGTRGDVYRTSSGASSIGALESNLKKRFLSSGPAGSSTSKPRMHGAEVTSVKPPDAAAKTPLTATLEVPNASGTKTTVEVTFKSAEPKDMPRGPHGKGGSESGPARMQVTRNADGSFSAEITVNRDLHATDAGDAIGHEFDEIAGLVHGNFKGPELAKQQLASMMRPNTGKRAPAPTVHDKAQVREFMNAYGRETGTPADRLANMEAKLQAWGLREPNHLDARMQFLLSEGVPVDVVKALHSSTAVATTVPKGGTAPLMSNERAGHVMYPEAGTSASMIGGGHFDPALGQRSVVGEYTVLVSERVGPDGATYRQYAQVKWTGGGPAPAVGDASIPKAIPQGQPGYPGVPAQPSTSSFKVFAEPKTTFSDSVKFMSGANEAWADFLKTAPATSGNFEWKGTAKNGMVIGGWASHDGTTFTVLSAYPDKSWVR